MIALARAVRGQPNATVLRLCQVHAGPAKPAMWTIRSSSSTTADNFVKSALASESRTRPRQTDDRTPRNPGRAQGRLLYHLGLPKQVQLQHSGSEAQYKRPVGEMTPNDLETAPITTAKQLRIRKHSARPRATVVTFSNLCEGTTIEDVLLCIREAAVAGKIGHDESRIFDARIRPARTRDKKAAYGTMVARLDFLRSIGATQIHDLTRAGRFEIKGVKPRASLCISPRARDPGPGGEDLPFTKMGTTTAVSDGWTGATDLPREAGIKNVIDRARLKDKLVRRTAYCYNRDPSSASQDEAQLQYDVAFRSTNFS